MKTVNNAIIQLGDIDDTGKGRHFVSRFIKDGLVKIEGHGIVLIQKPTIDMSLQSMIGAPVIIKHQDVTEDNADELRCGVISKAYFNDFDGWYYCEGVIWDKKAQKLIEKGWSVSCSYDFLSYKDDKGVENNIPYDKEFTQLNFTHLAIVNNPRYERANIVFNCKVDNDRWITIHPHGDAEDEDGKKDYRRLKLEDGESPKEAIDRVYKKKDKPDSKENERIDARHKHQEVVKKHQKVYEDFEKGIGTFEDIQKADEELKKSNDEFYGGKTEEKQDKKDLYSDENFKYNANRINQQYGEKPFSEWQKDVQTMLKKYGKTEADFDEAIGAKAENPEPPKEKTLEEKRDAYKTTLKKLQDAEHKKWKPKDNAEWYQAVKDGAEAKKALTNLRREYAEGIMSSFEEVEDNPYETKMADKKARYEELSGKANAEANRYAKTSSDMFGAIPFGQPIHGQRDRNYRDKAWGKMEKSWELSKKADYYADKAASVGKSGISADDKNAIKKIADKYNALQRTHQKMLDANKIIKSKGTDEEKLKKLVDAGWSEKNAQEIMTPSKWSGSIGFQTYELSSNTQEMRRLIDRVIDIHERSLKAVEKPADDYSKYGFNVERNTDINRLQLKFDNIPDANTRSQLKSHGFRWSPREGAWQRQMTGNAEYSLKRFVEGLKVNNDKEQDMALLDEIKKLITRVENNKEMDMEIENAKVDKRSLIDEVAGIMKSAGCDDEDIRTAIGKMEKIGYDKSEDGSADNCSKKVKNDDKKDAKDDTEIDNEDEKDKEEVEEVKEDVKEDVDNKCKNSKPNTFSFDKINEIYNSVKQVAQESDYVTRQQKLDNAVEYFK